ncbi:MAG: adenylate/guanylate cyclase domain-containing protein [Chloroflexi bacterium]|nr:adenylate/guanylate cyclase domain-containing protein [Chloroflexota bacterium]
MNRDGNQTQVEFEARAILQASPRALWGLVADTRRLNRAIGLPQLTYTVTPADDGGSNVAAAIRVCGVTAARWREYPFDWQEPWRYSVRREFEGGPLDTLTATVELRPQGSGVEVVASTEIWPRNAVGALVARVVGPRTTKRVIEQCRLFEQYLLGRAPNPFPQLRPRALESSRLVVICGELIAGGQQRALVERLREHLSTAPDEDVSSMRAFELADRWKADRHEILVLFLHATAAGLLTLSWDVLCPNCRLPNDEYHSLRELKGTGHCDVCNIIYDATFDRLVEVRFAAAPAIRPTSGATFCIGGPLNTPHRLAQVSLGVAEPERTELELEPGEYRLRIAPVHSECVLLVDETAAQDVVELAIRDGGVSPATTVVRPGVVTIRATNESSHVATLMAERWEWPDTATTAAYVSTIQEFRDLFSSEVLSPGLQLGIQRLAFMFTDLAGSTAMYQAVGQARAFRLVQDHFRILGLTIRDHRGSLVKTIGDAVMATFSSPSDALAAALEIQRRVRALDTGGLVDASRLVKIGLHAGPCLAVNLNERLDYFGTTVNVAARVEHECRGGQIVATDAVVDDPEARALLSDLNVMAEPYATELRGVSGLTRAYRIVRTEG